MEVDEVNHNRDGRSHEDILSVLEFAKLPASDLHSRTQCVFFSENLDNEHLKLMEMDPAVLDTLTAGDRVVIRGDKDDGAVLCTRNKTFEIKEAETSNSLLILPRMQFGQDLPADGEHTVEYIEVVSVLDKYFELRPAKPRVKKLKSLLSENQFSGRECEEDDDHKGKKYTYNDLLDCVQASEDEMSTTLKSLRACVIDGHWRMLDFDYVTQVLNHVLQLCEENDWLTDCLDLGECITTLQELFPRNVIEHIVRSYADPKSSEGKTSESLYIINEDKVCRFFAELTLRNAGKFHFTEFLQVWQQCVPEGMRTSLHQIEGIVLIDQDTMPPVIWYFTADNLPEDITERFEYLFQTRKKWTLGEIKPYIQDLTTEKVDVGTLLLKHARGSTHNGVRVFSSRKTTS